MAEAAGLEAEAQMSSREDKTLHCPHCGGPIAPGRLPGATNVWDVVRIAVIFGGIIGILLVMKVFS
jgi:hypothetical protein